MQSTLRVWSANIDAPLDFVYGVVMCDINLLT